MKKLFAVLVVLAMVIGAMGLFAGCSSSNNEFKVAVIHIGNADDTAGYTYAQQKGINYMAEKLGLKKSQIILKNDVKDTDATATSNAINEAIAEGANMVIGTSFGYMDPMLDAAKANPDVIFTHATGYKSNFGEGTNNNMNNFFGRIYQARYLSGIVAGLKASQGGKIGFVAAHGNNIAEISSGVNAFTLGVQAVNPTAQVLVQKVGNWLDAPKEIEVAKNLLAKDCEVITQHGDTSGPSNEAKNAGKFSIGYNSDMGKEVDSDSVLTSVLWNWGVYYEKAVAAAMKCFDGNTFVSTDAWVEFGNYYGEYKDGLFDLNALSSQAAPGTEIIVNLVKEQMMKGVDSWDVFSDKALLFTERNGAYSMSIVDRPLYDNNGNRIENVTVANITGNMPYWIKGVTEII